MNSIFVQLLLVALSGGLYSVAAEHIARGQKLRVASTTGAALGKLRGAAHSTGFLDDLHQAVSEALGAGHDVQRSQLNLIHERLAPMWAALAKSDEGRIDRRSLRYVAHRYFLQTYGLSLLGLEPLQANSSHEEAALLSAYAPLYVQRVAGGNTATRGFSLEDTVTMVAVLERLVGDSTHDMLEASYAALNRNVSEVVARADMKAIIEGFMLRFMLGGLPEVALQVEQDDQLLYEAFEDWDSLADFAGSQVLNAEAAWQSSLETRPAGSAWNPLDRNFSFTDSQAVASNIVLSFGRFWETECARVKGLLTAMDHTHSGRVKLSDFHDAALNGEWRFSESASYLREMGALDESSKVKGPRVIIANYMQAPSNCIVSTDHFRVCCVNECEVLMGELEAVVRGPFASADFILGALQNITDQTFHISPSLRSQLYEVAQTHGGRVPLHGRLFAQWLHYAFPRECPFPHKSGTTTSMMPHEYGDEYLASVDEMAAHVKDNSTGAKETLAIQAAELGVGAEAPAAAELADEVLNEEWMTQWSPEEELLSSVHLQAPWDGPVRMPLLLLLSGMVVSMLIFKGASSKERGRAGLGRVKDALPIATSRTGKAHFL